MATGPDGTRRLEADLERIQTCPDYPALDVEPAADPRSSAGGDLTEPPGDSR